MAYTITITVLPANNELWNNEYEIPIHVAVETYIRRQACPLLAGTTVIQTWLTFNWILYHTSVYFFINNNSWSLLHVMYIGIIATGSIIIDWKKVMKIYDDGTYPSAYIQK